MGVLVELDEDEIELIHDARDFVLDLDNDDDSNILDGLCKKIESGRIIESLKIAFGEIMADPEKFFLSPKFRACQIAINKARREGKTPEEQHRLGVEAYIKTDPNADVIEKAWVSEGPKYSTGVL